MSKTDVVRGAKRREALLSRLRTYGFVIAPWDAQDYIQYGLEGLHSEVRKQIQKAMASLRARDSKGE